MFKINISHSEPHPRTLFSWHCEVLLQDIHSFEPQQPLHEQAWYVQGTPHSQMCMMQLPVNDLFHWSPNIHTRTLQPAIYVKKESVSRSIMQVVYMSPTLSQLIHPEDNTNHSHWHDIIMQEVHISHCKWVKTNQNRQTDLPHPARMFQSHSSARTGCGQVTVCIHTNGSHCVQRCQNLNILELWQ